MDELGSEILEALAAKTFFIDFIVCFGTMDECSTVNQGQTLVCKTQATSLRLDRAMSAEWKLQFGEREKV